MACISPCATAAGSRSCLTFNSFSASSSSVKVNSQVLGTRKRPVRFRPTGLRPFKCSFKTSINAAGAGIYGTQSPHNTDEDDEQAGVEKQVLKAGSGSKLVAGQTVTVHCTGYGKNGDLSQEFWSTNDAGQQPFTFKVGQGSVIKGWDEGVIGMQVGEVARLRCSPDYAYGSSGFPAWGIQPNSVLVFEIEVLKLE